MTVEKMRANGSLLWNTFLGGTFDDYGYGLAVSDSGAIFITGRSEGLWIAGGSPVSPYNDVDASVARLDASGNLIWRTFTGGNGAETGTAIPIDGSGNVVVTGYSDESWGSPLHGHAGGADDGFVMQLNAVTGNRFWNTFLGSSGADTAWSIAVEVGGKIFVTGVSDAAWGSAVRAYTGVTDGFVAQLNSVGTLTWNTFLGRSGNDSGASA